MKPHITTILYMILATLLLKGVQTSRNITVEQLNELHSVATILEVKSREIQKYMNETADPCENFYEFACGYWSQLNPATSMENPTTGFMVSLLRVLDGKLREILKVQEDHDNDSDKMVKNFYQSCLKASTSNDTDKLRDIIKEFGEMPMLVGDTWQEQNFDWSSIAARIAYEYDIKILMDISIGKAIVNPNENSIFIDAPNFYLKPHEANEVYLSREYSNAIALKLIKYLKISALEAHKTAKEIVDLEKALVQGTLAKHLQRNFSEVYEDSTLEEVQQKYGHSLNLKEHINKTLGTVPLLKVYTNRGYMENLLKVLKTTAKRQLANYVFYQLLDNFISQLPATEQHTEDHCMLQVKTNFIMHLDHIIYRRYSTKAAETSINEMWLAVKKVFKTTLESSKLSWLDRDTQKLALKKLQHMKLEIVSYQQQLTSEEFSGLSLNRHDYLENLKSLQSFKAYNERVKQLNPDNGTAYSYAQFWSPNPYYMLDENVLKIPAAILMPYYTWSTKFPNALNYGMLGSMLAHELIHAFDETGRLFDWQGRQHQWWDLESIKAFEERTKCFRDQYQKYKFGGRFLPLMSDQSENIADNAGIRLAYEAYSQWLEYLGLDQEDNEDFERLPGLQCYNNQQLFFLSYAHMWCSDTFEDFRHIQTSLDVHVPAEFRVIGPLANLKEFSAAFNCPQGSGMNPHKKCELY